MNKKIIIKPLVLMILFAAALLCAFYFTKKYDNRLQADGFKHEEESYIATYRVRYKKDFGGSDSPEECYEAFKSAMLEHNLDKALSFVFVDERPKYEYQLGQYLKEGKSYEDIANALPKKINKIRDSVCDIPLCSVYLTSYYEGARVFKGEIVNDDIAFVKTFNNKWQIESF